MAKGNKTVAAAAVNTPAKLPDVAVSQGSLVVTDKAWTEQDTAALKADLQTYKGNLTEFKVQTHSIALRCLTHAHNTGDLSLVQQFFDILDEDKLMRKAAFAKWVQKFAPANFDDDKKKFFKDKSEERIRFFYHEDKEIGSALLAGANGVRFWDLPGGEEKVNPTLFDIMYMQFDKILERAKREQKKGKYDAETAEERSIRDAALKQIETTYRLIEPMTTAKLLEQAASGAVDAEVEMVDETKAA